MSSDNGFSENEVMPLPSVVTSFREDVSEPIQWEVIPTAGDFGARVDFTAGVIAVPLGGDEYSQRLQLQKIIEARISPMDQQLYKHIAAQHVSDGISEGMVRIAEQSRIAAITKKFCDAKGLPDEPDGSEKIMGKRLATAGDARSWDKAVEITLLKNGTKAFDAFASGVRSVNPEWSAQLRKLAKRLTSVFDGHPTDIGNTAPYNYGDGVTGPAGFMHTLYAANEVSSYLSTGYKAPREIKQLREKDEDERAANYGDGPEPVSMKNALAREDSPLNTDDMPDDFEFNVDNGEFGKLVFAEDMPLTVEVSGYMRRKRKGMQSGRRVTYPSRLLTDPERRIFGQKVKVKGGIVVIDLSGSMSLSQQDIEAIVTAAPAAVIMGYSDCGGGEPNAWIFANRGWRVRDIGHVGGQNNGVDGTALTWAVRHRKYGEDIVWVSDGEVTSMGGGQRNELVIQCAKIVKKNRIIMIPSVREAVAMFKANKMVNKPAGPIRAALLGKI